MKRWITIFLIIFLFACSGSGAKDLYETAQFEELQTNYPHAIELYEEIVKDHPKSEFAKKAKDRLKAIEEMKKK